jgi:hypothetical protein
MRLIVNWNWFHLEIGGEKQAHPFEPEIDVFLKIENLERANAWLNLCLDTQEFHRSFESPARLQAKNGPTTGVPYMHDDGDITECRRWILDGEVYGVKMPVHPGEAK